LEIAKIAEKHGIKMITIHGRTRKQYYSGIAKYDMIKKVKENVSIPVIANGDITSPKKAFEVLEETGVEYEIDYLAVIHENFFNDDKGSHKGMDCHEIAMYFMMKPRGTRELNSESYVMGVKETMHWIPVEDIHKYKAFPSFMKEYLESGYNGIKHIITDERV